MQSRNFAILCLMLCIGASNIVAADPTWSGSVAKIVYNKCTSCHRTGEIAPFTLQSYEDVVSHGYTIKSVTQSGYMPPWKPLPGHGSWLGDRSLSMEEKSTILAWVDAGMPLGDASQAPDAPTFPTGSQLGTPDLVLEMPQEWNVEGNNKDVYRYFVLPSTLLENRSIAAMEFRPGNAAVVHHVLYFLDTTGTARKKDQLDPLPGYGGFGDPGFESASSYLGWVPGAQQRFFPDNIGAVMFKGSDLVIQVHYAPTSIPQTDRSKVNIFFHKNPFIRVLQEFTLSPANSAQSFIIPANTKRSFTSSYTVPLDVSIIGIAPHMHLLGTKARAFAVTPKGDTIRLVSIGDWDFNWQGSYAYKNPVKVPTGSTLFYIADYDNTTANPLNPNSPPRLTTWGESTTDEMLLCYFFWLPYFPGDENIQMETNRPTTAVAEESVVVTTVSLAPNPAINNTQLSFVAENHGTITVTIVSSTGEQVYAQSLPDCLPGEHSIQLPTEQLANGAYFVRLTGNAYTTTMPLTVQH